MNLVKLEKSVTVGVTVAVTLLSSMMMYAQSATVNAIYGTDVYTGADVYRSDFNGDGREDIAFQRYAAPGIYPWYVSLSTTANGIGVFSNPILFHNDIGEAGDEIFIGNFDGLNEWGSRTSDILIRRKFGTNSYKWYVARSNGSSFLTPAEWGTNIVSQDGDFTYTGDFNGDRKFDIAIKRRLSATQHKWFVSLSSGTNFGALNEWHYDIGNDGDDFYIGNFDGLNGADIGIRRKIATDIYQWYISRSNTAGNAFQGPEQWHYDISNDNDTVKVGNFNGVGGDDLLFTRRTGTDTYALYFVASNVNTMSAPPIDQGFATPVLWSTDIGDDKDMFITGDYNGDGKHDIALKRFESITQQSWYVGLNINGSGVSSPSLWHYDISDQTDVVFA